MTRRLAIPLLVLSSVVLVVLCGCRQPQQPATGPSLRPAEGGDAPPEKHAVAADEVEPPAEPEGGWPKRKIAATILTQQHPFYQRLSAAFEAAAERYNCSLTIQSCEMKSSQQRAQVQTFVAQGVDAIIVCPADSSAVGGTIQIANEADIPVFTADIAAFQGDVVCHIASDNEQGGRLAGEYMCGLLPDGGELAIIDHPMVTSVQDRVRGFEQAVGERPDIVIVAKESAGGKRGPAQTKTSHLLQAHPNLSAIFGINDDSALGALAAVRNAGRQDDIVIVGYDAEEEARREIAAGGPLKADVTQYPDEIGRLTIETIVNHLNRETVPDQIDVPVGIVDRDSLSKEPGSEAS